MWGGEEVAQSGLLTGKMWVIDFNTAEPMYFSGVTETVFPEG